MSTSSEIRQQFIDFFVKKHGHTFVPSSPVVPHGDETLLFANAGMNQFKPYFLGTEEPPYPRAANTQKCIRAGGKHNDLDDVGKDTYHHTFFEMLGNWSFGNYFKEEAIAWAWELLVDVWKLDPDRIHATYFEGDADEGLDPDIEARDLWLRFLPAERVHPGNKKDNFWEMGDTGPCGPCSEIHYDGTADKQGGDHVNADNPDVIEVWNLVFIQFNRGANGKLSPLPAKHVDTGMGFERITRILQSKTSNYDSDVFTPLFDAIQKVTGARKYDGGKNTLQDPIDIAYRVIADHIRTLSFALSDGAHCGNTGRDSVLRTILRRAVRYGHQQLGVEEPFFYRLVPAVVQQMGDFFPELKKKPGAVANELREEEESFRKTLARGISIFDRAVQGLKRGDTLDGETAFDLESTYGFPISLTRLMAEERGLSVDSLGYDTAKAKHADVSRGKGTAAEDRPLLVEIVQQHDLPATEFVGHDHMELEADTRRWLFVRKETSFEQADAIEQGQRAALVVEKTPFYSEAGGQISDIGLIEAGDARLRVSDTFKVGDVYFHIGQVEQGTLTAAAEPQPAKLEVSRERRCRIMSNHTTTHVMNRALRDLVNPEADQRGSLVDEERLRFDFSNVGPVNVEQIAAVEQQVNRDIEADLPVYAQVAPQEEALKIRGLRAVFGEKYPPRVRVVSIGTPVDDLLAEPDNDRWGKTSIEFCGGTHLPSTGEAEAFTVVNEEGVAKGVRRITALTGEAAKQAEETGQTLLTRAEGLKEARDSDPAKLSEEVGALMAAVEQQQIPLRIKDEIRKDIADLQALIKKAQKQRAKASATAVVDVAREIAEEESGPVIVRSLGEVDGDALRTAMDVIKAKRPEAALLLIGAGDGKVAIVAAVPQDLIKQGLKAGDWVRETAKAVGGGGGGRPDMAQAGGKDPEKVDDALEVARQFAMAKV